MFNKIWFKFPERVSLKTLVLRTPKWYVYPRLRTTALGQSISLKFSLETRLEFESFEPLIDFPAFLVQKL